jgi:hypothetical protein
MHHTEVLIPKARHFDQLAEERRWLRGEIPGSFLAPRGNWRPPPEWTAFAERVEQVLARPELRNVLRVLEERNRNRSKRANPFLLGPYLFSIIHRIEARREYRQQMPALGRRPAELRAHFQDASKKAKALARVVRKGPQPFTSLAARAHMTDAFKLFQPGPIIQSPKKQKSIVPLDRLLDEAAGSLDLLAENISRPSARGSVKSEAAGFLAITFRNVLKKPYHSEVATIVQVLTGKDTDEDYVKKIEKRWAATGRGQKP